MKHDHQTAKKSRAKGGGVARKGQPLPDMREGNNHRVVTMNDVAREAGVSLKTVSNVVNDYPYVRPQTRERVENAIQRLGYQMNISARNLRRGRTGVIGLALPELAMPFMAELAEKFMVEAEQRGLRVIVELTGNDRTKERTVLTGPDRSMTDGLLYYPEVLTKEDFEALDIPYPLVLLGESIFTQRVDHVTMANTEAAQAATRHLLSCGARRIALLGYRNWDEENAGSLRYTGYATALKEAGLVPAPELLWESDLWRRTAGAEVTRRAIERGVEFDAIFAMNDAMALGALHTLRSHNIRVPEDVQVMGFDDIEEAAYSSPTLSTVAAGTSQIVKAALDLIEQRVAGTGLAQKQLVVAPYRLIWRDSTRG
jgi:DNA-binding LacI/PurR family transcriptional regulator